MRVLLVAPNAKDINQIPEIRQLTSLHRTTVLNGEIRAQDVFEEARQREYDIVHFATHLVDQTEHDKMYVNDREVITLADADSILKLAKAKMAFFNFCDSSRFATFVTNRGLDCAVFTTKDIADSAAWRFPMAFYEQIKRQENNALFSFNEVYDNIAPSDGTYGFVAGIHFYRGYYRLLKEKIEELEKKIDTVIQIVQTHSITLGDPINPNQIKNKTVIGLFVVFGIVTGYSSIVTIIQSWQ